MCTETARPPIFTDKDNLFCGAALYNWWGPGWTIKCWMWGWFTERSPYFKAFYFSNWRWSLFWDIWCFTVKTKYILYFRNICNKYWHLNQWVPREVSSYSIVMKWVTLQHTRYRYRTSLLHQSYPPSWSLTCYLLINRRLRLRYNKNMDKITAISLSRLNVSPILHLEIPQRKTLSPFTSPTSRKKLHN